jgi:hypothetical protein
MTMQRIESKARRVFGAGSWGAIERDAAGWKVEVWKAEKGAAMAVMCRVRVAGKKEEAYAAAFAKLEELEELMGVEAVVAKACTPRARRAHKRVTLEFLAKTTGSKSGGHPVHTVDPTRATHAMCGLELGDRSTFNGRPDPAIETCQRLKPCGSCASMRSCAEERVAFMNAKGSS